MSAERNDEVNVKESKLSSIVNIIAVSIAALATVAIAICTWQNVEVSRNMSTAMREQVARADSNLALAQQQIVRVDSSLALSSSALTVARKSLELSNKGFEATISERKLTVRPWVYMRPVMGTDEASTHPTDGIRVRVKNVGKLPALMVRTALDVMPTSEYFDRIINGRVLIFHWVENDLGYDCLFPDQEIEVTLKHPELEQELDREHQCVVFLNVNYLEPDSAYHNNQAIYFVENLEPGRISEHLLRFKSVAAVPGENWIDFSRKAK